MFSMDSKLEVSGNVSGKFDCTWTIEGFSTLDAQEGACHRSDAFHLEENGREWHLEIYPGGREYRDRGFVTCALHGVNNLIITNWKYDITLRKNDGVELFKGRLYETVFYPSEAQGLAVNIATGVFRLVDDVLVVILEANYAVDNVKGVLGTRPRTETVSFRHLSNDWRNLWTSGDNTDFEIHVEGQKIPVHSLVLSARSEMLAALLRNPMSEKSTRSTDITDFEVDVVKSLVEFIYTGHVRQMSFDLGIDLIGAGNKYRVKDLKSYCATYLMPLIDNDNACQILECADFYDVENLRSHALDYIGSKLSEDELEAQSELFKTKPDLLWSIFKLFLKERKTMKN